MKKYSTILLSSLSVSIFLSYCLAKICPKFSHQFSNFTVGSVAWNTNEKISNYVFYFSFIFILPIFFLFLKKFSFFIKKNSSAKMTTVILYKYLSYINLIILFMLSSLVFKHLDTNIYVINYTFLCTFLIFTLILTILYINVCFNQKPIYIVNKIIFSILTSVIFIYFSIISIKVHSYILYPINKKYLYLSLVIFFISCLAFLSYELKKNSQNIYSHKILVIFSQLFIFINWIKVYPREILEGKIESNLNLDIVFYFLLSISIISLLSKLYNISLKKEKQLVSPFTYVLIIFCILNYSNHFIKIPTDNYHFGEIYLPFWTLLKFGHIPFVDYTAVRGLINYLPGFLSYLLLDLSASSICFTPIYISLFFITISYFFLRKIHSSLLSFLIILFMQYKWGFSFFSRPFIYSIYFICYILLFYFFKHKGKYATFIYWLITGNILFFTCLSYGAVWIISSSPFIFYLIFKNIKNRKFMIIIFSLLIIVLFLLFIPNNIRNFTLSSFSYLLDQSRMNTVAHSSLWISESFLTEIIRNSFILVFFIILYFLYLSCKIKNVQLSLSCLFIFLSILLFIPQAAGRIGGGYTRLGNLSSIMLGAFLPHILIVYNKKLNYYAILCIVLFQSAFVYFSKNIFLWEMKNPHEISTHNYKDGSAYSLPNIGFGEIDDKWLKKLVNLKNDIDKTVINNDETFYDFTSASALYFLLDYEPPVSDVAAYNAVSEQQQFKVVNSLHKKNIPFIIAKTNRNYFWDGGTPSLRNYLIYRFTINNYIPVFTGKNIYFLKDFKEYFNHDIYLNLLNECFYNYDLKFIPYSWGKDSNNLQPKLVDKFFLKKYLNTDINNYLSKHESSIEYKFNDLSINGREVGILMFDIKAINIKNMKNVKHAITYNISFSSNITNHSSKWSNIKFSSYNGRVIIPLDSFPNWLLSDKISSLRISALNLDKNTNIYIEQGLLAQRNVATEIDSIYFKRNKNPDQELLPNTFYINDPYQTVANISNKDWNHGIANNKKSILLTLSDFIVLSEEIHNPKKIIWENGQERNIELIEFKPNFYVIITVDGNPLSPDLHSSNLKIKLN